MWKKLLMIGVDGTMITDLWLLFALQCFLILRASSTLKRRLKGGYMPRIDTQRWQGSAFLQRCLDFNWDSACRSKVEDNWKLLLIALLRTLSFRVRKLAEILLHCSWSLISRRKWVSPKELTPKELSKNKRIRFQLWKIDGPMACSLKTSIRKLLNIIHEWFCKIYEMKLILL